MKVKFLLMFYFNAERLNSRLDGAILRRAYRSYSECGGGYGSAEEICSIIGEKAELNGLWNYLDGAVRALPEGDRQILERYASAGLKGKGGGDGQKLKNAVAKFSRRIKRAGRYSAAVAVAAKYRGLLAPPPE